MTQGFRLKKLREVMGSNSVQGVLIFDSSDIFYLTGVASAGILAVKEDKARLYIPSVNFEEERIKADSSVECRSYFGEAPWEEVGTYMTGKQVALDSGRIAYDIYAKVNCIFEKTVLIRDMVSGLRSIKDHQEIGLLREAGRRAARIIDSINIDEWLGKTESELAAFLALQSWKNGCSGSPFTPVVGSGVNSAYPHHLPSQEYIQTGWLKVDFGVRYRGYCSDLTRIYILDKLVDNLDSEELFSHLKQAYINAVEVLTPGTECSKVYDTARGTLEEYGLDEYFIHNLGHGVGIDVHEAPYLKPGNSQILEPGMVVTVEPGFYMPGIGGMRIEDTFLISEKGSERLTKTFR